MFPRWFYILMIVGYLANICATIPHVHSPGDGSRPHVHTDRLMGEMGEGHAHGHHAHSHDHGQDDHRHSNSANRPAPPHDHDCLFLAVSGTAITSAKTAPPEANRAVGLSFAVAPTVAGLPVSLVACESTLDLHGAAAPHCARFLELRTLRI